MSDERTEDEVEESFQQQLRRGQRFTLADVIGREGGGYMRDASPVPRTKQAAAAVHRLLGDHLDDVSGCVRKVLEADIVHDLAALERHRPAGAILERVERLLGNEAALRGFVRRVDTEWGRMMVERPHFQRPDRPPHPEDEYTWDSVRRALEQLVHRLRATG